VKQKLAAQTTEVPIIVVCNKVDDAVNQEMVLILSEFKGSTANIVSTFVENIILFNHKNLTAMCILCSCSSFSRLGFRLSSGIGR
jgi:hypothetical protein